MAISFERNQTLFNLWFIPGWVTRSSDHNYDYTESSAWTFLNFVSFLFLFNFWTFGQLLLDKLMEIKRERDLVEFRVAALAFAADDLGSKETHTRVESARRRAPNSSGVSHDDQTPQVSTFYVLRWVLSDPPPPTSFFRSQGRGGAIHITMLWGFTFFSIPPSASFPFFIRIRTDEMWKSESKEEGENIPKKKKRRGTL